MLSSPAPAFELRALKVHPAAGIFAQMSDEELAKLAKDVEQHGQRQIVDLYRTTDGELVLLHGRSRIAACERAGVRVRWSVWDGPDPFAHVLNENLESRVLKDSQRAMVAARLNVIHGTRTADAAVRLNTSEPSLKRARVVVTRGTEELIRAVDLCRISVNAAEFIAKLPKEQQPGAMAQAMGPKKKPPSRVDHETRRRRILKLHEEGHGTYEIAAKLKLARSTVSKEKVTLGVANNSPSEKLWRDMDHLTNRLAGTSGEILRVAGEVAGTSCTALEQERVQACIDRLSSVSGAIRRLSGNLKKLTMTR